MPIAAGEHQAAEGYLPDICGFLPGQVIEATAGISGFCARFLLAPAVTIVFRCVRWTITYLALLLWAMFTNGKIGGPLAYPAAILVLVECGTSRERRLGQVANGSDARTPEQR